MTVHTVPILAAVTSNEQAVVERAALDLAKALGQATGESWTCPCTFAPEFDRLVGATSGSIVVTSLHLAMTDVDRPWPEVEQELHDSYSALCEAGDTVLICTILRHVDAAEDFERAARIRRRIRKLNLLATELSRLYGAFVIDFDRVLADVGARRLETDFRLGGTVAMAFAGKTVAICIAANALDAFAPEKAQSAACAILVEDRPAAGLDTREMMTNIMPTGRGARKQLVATVTDEVPENHVGWLIRQMLKRQIGGRDAFTKLAGAMRRRGVRESTGLLISGLLRMLKPAEADRRT
jgi:hypothetical protein